MRTGRNTVCIIFAFCAAFAAGFTSCEQLVEPPPEEPVYTYYTVHYEANGGSGTMEDSVFICGKEQTLRYGFYRGGCSFAGWATSPDGEIVYAEAQSVTDLAAAGETITLYAVWTLHADAFMIKYDANGGDGHMISTVFTHATYPVNYYPGGTRAGYAPEYLSSNTFTRTGFAFAGWAMSPDGPSSVRTTWMNGANRYDVRDLFAEGETITLYAVWGTLYYTVSFDANASARDIIGTMPSQDFAYGVAQNLRRNGFFRVGYTFAGWATSEKGAVEYADEQSMVNLDTSLTLYAVWLNDRYYTYTVWYDANGGSGSLNIPRYIIDRPYNLMANNYTRYGYTFGGWATSPDGPAVYADEQTVTNLGAAGEMVTLYAAWDICPDAYFVEYDANGGDGTTLVSTLVINEPLNLRPHNFTRANYAFIGWATSPNGEAVYTNGQIVTNLTTAGETVTLYAVWAGTYTVSYSANAGDGTMSSQNFIYGIAQKLSRNTFYRNYFTFTGWATSPNGAVEYADEQSVSDITDTPGAEVTLYAVWGRNYTVYYYANGGSGSMSAQGLTYGITQNLKANAFTRTGYTFKGWAKTASGAVEYTDEQSVSNLTTGGLVELYAVWEINSATAYTVQYDANDGSGRTVTSDFVIDVPQALRDNFTRAGYAFAGWAETSSGNAVYTNRQIVTNLAAAGAIKTLYAKWGVSNYTVAYDANGGGGTMEAQDFTYDKEQKLRANSFVYTGYAFAGWAETSFGAVKYADEQSVSNLTATQGATVTLYAKWADFTYTVKYNSNGGSGAFMNDQTFTHNVPQNLRTNTFTRTGYLFIGWATSPNGAAEYNNGQSVSLTSPQAMVTLYAKWRPITYTIKYDGNGANYSNGPMNDQIFTYDVEQALRKNSFSRSGNFYEFDGWSLTRDGPIQYSNEATILNLTSVDGATITLYAVWWRKR